MPYWYFASYVYETNRTGFAGRRCAGLSYPGALVGWAPTWNDNLIYATQNSMVPKASRAGGLAAAFVQRRAICGAATLADAAATVEATVQADWADDGAVLGWLRSNEAAVAALLAESEKAAVVAKLKALFQGRDDAEALVAAAMA